MLTGVHSENFSTVILHGGFIVRRPRFKFTGKLVDHFDNLDVDTMSMFEIVSMVEKLGITYNVKVFWQLADKPIEVKQLKTDADFMEMVSNLPRDHYVHLYLEEVVGFSETKMDEPGLGEVEMDEPGLGEAEMDEPDIGEPEMDETELGELEMDEHVMDEPELGEPEMDEHESEVRLESESDSEDEEYVAGSESSSAVSSFTGRENEIVSSEDEVDEESNVNVGLGSDEVDVQSESGHSDSLHIVGEADSDGAQKHVREGLVAILEDLDKHPHLLQELQEFQNFQLEDLQLPQQAMVRTLQGQPQQAMLESLQGQPQQAMLETLQGQPYCQLDLQKSILLDGCPPQQQQTMLECPQQLPMVAPPQDQPHCQLNLNKVTL
ncbi:hypothetical protein V6N11_030538 [Hibiscus sabdariffa]|uniref:PB1-like domain-containing protein n=1 Tax=Hibiscus sabdariffa TaxID=183260 RepID=A0ABR2N7C1_9ROSI